MAVPFFFRAFVSWEWYSQDTLPGGVWTHGGGVSQGPIRGTASHRSIVQHDPLVDRRRSRLIWLDGLGRGALGVVDDLPFGRG